MLWHAAVEVVHCPVFRQKIPAPCTVGTNGDVQVRVAVPGQLVAVHCPLATDGGSGHCAGGGGAEVWHAAVDVVHCPVFKHVIAAFCSVETAGSVQVRVAWEPGVEPVTVHCPLAMNGGSGHVAVC